MQLCLDTKIYKIGFVRFESTMTNYKLTDKGLYYKDGQRWERLGGKIKVLARTRLPGFRHGHSILLEWVNYDNITLKEVVYARDITGEQSRLIREMLVDSGYPLELGSSKWKKLQAYLFKCMEDATPATVVNKTGWHGNVFATSPWTIGESKEPYYYLGQNTNLIQELGSLKDWQNNIGKLCQGNSIAIFSVGMSLAAPLLSCTGFENGAFHLVGLSSLGKTTLLQIAASVYGSSNYLRSWVSTSNGLAAVSSEHNDMLLPLDEIGMARPEDVDVAIYQIMNGSGKLRATISGDLAPTDSWRTLVLSTGEVWISELLEQIGKPLKAGQQTRLVEIPIFGNFGAFEELHGRRNSREFVDELKSVCGRFHGSLIREWITTLTEQGDALGGNVTKEIDAINDSWTTNNMASQVRRVVRRFALVATALRMGSRRGLLPWSENESTQSVYKVLQSWLATRSHIFNHEEYRLLRELWKVINSPKGLVSHSKESLRKDHLAFERNVDGEAQWLFPKDRFLKHFHIPARYMREVEPLLQKNFLETNERSRGTLRLMINDRYYRFFALWPERVDSYLREVTKEESQFLPSYPTYPSCNKEISEHE